MILLAKIILIGALAADSAVVAPEISVSSSLSVQQAAVGDTFEYYTTVVFPDNPLYWFWDSLKIPLTMGLEFVGSETKTISKSDGDSIMGETTIAFRFSPTREGKLTMSDGYFRLLWFPDGDTINIDTALVHYPGFSIEGIPSPLKSPGTLPLWMLVIGITAIVLVIIVLRIHVKKARVVSLTPSRPPTPSEKALAELSKISVRKLSAEKILDGIAKIIREYISDKYEIPATGMSSGEIIVSLEQKDLVGHKIIELKQILKFCDDVRFAEKYPESDELENVYDMTKNFVSE